MSLCKTIGFSELEEALNTRFSVALQKRCEEANLQYEDISDEERDNYIREVVEVLVKNDADADTRPAGEHRLGEWEKGWAENLEAIRKGKSVNDLIPKYYGKRKLVRWKQKMIKPLIADFDYRILSIIVDWAIDNYCSKASSIFEFGCGPAYHLLRARNYNKDANLIGLDWTTASQEIIRQIREAGIEERIEGKNFNFFTPDYSVEIPVGSAFLTVAALEQIGNNFEAFLDFILEKNQLFVYTWNR